MDDNKGKIKIKFCESLDRFVEIRVFTEIDINKLFNNVKISDKKSYKRLILSTAILNYHEEIMPMIFGDNNYSLFGEIAEQELYNLCISVNSTLDIKKVTITIEENGAKEEGLVPLLDEADETDDDISDRLLNMESYIKKRIVGQDEAVKVVSMAIRKAHIGLRNPDRPIGTFLFVGQTGVGKTELAKVLTDFFVGNEKELIRIDCSEFSQSHEYAKLIGAPPGYVGHKDGGMLTEAVKDKPRSVVLFDEIEKAHEKVHNLLLQIMDAGILTDSKGTQVSFKNCVILMTSNVGVKSVKSTESSIGFGDHVSIVTHDFKTKEMLKTLKKAFKPEFINRIDEIVNFRELDYDDNLKIVEIILSDVLGRLNNIGLDLKVTKVMKKFLVDQGWDPKMGARPLKRSVQRYVESVLSEMILDKKFTRGDVIKVRVNAAKKTLTYYCSDTKKKQPEKKKGKKEKTK
ncbi:ATP-dependent Clp protease ATP-binding subunit [bacterium]|nr:ATP-dependent Clp protease ATP-binding subunit [bacterium]